MLISSKALQKVRQGKYYISRYCVSRHNYLSMDNDGRNTQYKCCKNHNDLNALVSTEYTLNKLHVHPHKFMNKMTLMHLFLFLYENFITCPFSTIIVKSIDNFLFYVWVFKL